MSVADRLAHIFRGWVRLACVYVTLAVIAGPAALGAAMGPVLSELGATQEHVCKCGMPQGNCGCPECVRLEKRHSGKVPDAIPTLKRHCDDDAYPVPFTATSVVIVPPQLYVLPAATSDVARGLLPCTVPASLDLERSTPPPRSASV